MAPRSKRPRISDRLVARLERRFGGESDDPKKRRRAGILVNALAFVLATVFTFFALEVPYVCSLGPMLILVGYVGIELLILLVSMVALWFLAQRHNWAPKIVVIFFCVVGLIQRYTYEFRGTTITPVDLYAMGTAAAVAGQYDYLAVIDVWIVLGVVAAVLGCLCLNLLRPHPLDPEASLGKRIRTNLICGLALVAVVAAGVTVPSYRDVFYVWLNQWHINECYQQQGFLCVFIAAAQDMKLVEPEGYSDENAEAIEESLAAAWDEQDAGDEARAAAIEQFDEEQPSVIVIMNESFADLSTFGVIDGYEGPTYVRDELSAESVASGNLYVSVQGGGTCNTEFEFLTGLPMAFLGSRKYPYVQYDFSETDNLARQLGDLGYDTTAIHPNNANNWDRKKVYAQMGFDDFLSIEDFEGGSGDPLSDFLAVDEIEGVETYHNGVSDGATYDRILEILESDDDPQFVFDVTMANHSGYDVGNIPDQDQVHYTVDGISTLDYRYINEYLACINKSEADLRDFVDELRELDRPVILVFFGDHQPYMTDWFLYSTDEHELTAEETHRLYETPYLVWANYDVAGASNLGSKRDAEVYSLSSDLLQLVGGPLSNYEKALLGLESDMPAANCYTIEDYLGQWWWLDDSPDMGVPQRTADAREDLRQVSYYYYERLKN